MIQERILDLIISKCLEIDVEIVIEDSGEVKMSYSVVMTMGTTTMETIYRREFIQRVHNSFQQKWPRWQTSSI
jgi:hypothetical protein